MRSRRQTFAAALAVLPTLLLGCSQDTGAQLSSIAISPSPVNLSTGQTQQLVVTATFGNGSKAPVQSGLTFASSAPSVASVSTAGVVTALTAGAATVTATTAGLTATTHVTVSALVPTLVSIAVTPGTNTLSLAGTQQLTVTGTYSDSSTANLTSASTFSSSAPAVATVTATGLVTAVGIGTATITATHTASGQKATATVSVTAPTLVSIALSPSSASVAATRKVQLTVVGTYSDGSEGNVTAGSTFLSSAPSVATVNTAGTVSGVAIGNATITATHTASGNTATAAISVTAAPTLLSISVTPNPVSMVVQGARQLTVTGSYSDSSTEDLTTGSTFISSAPGVVSVSTAGLLTGVSVGTATITATNTASGKTATTSVSVTLGPVLLSIAVTPNPVNLPVAGTQQLNVTGTYNDSSTGDVTAGCTFSSDTPAVATVSPSGLVTAVALGTATATATHTASGLTATAPVNVATTTGGHVFFDGYDPGVTFVGFGGASNSVTIDPTQTNNGRKSLKVIVTSVPGGYSGGAFVAAVPRNLSGFNALTFWAKASVTNVLNVTGIGNDAGPTEGYSAESLTIPLTTTWTKFIIPIPVPAKLTANDGLFHFADGPKGYTFWLNDIQYESLSSAQVAPPIAASVLWPASPLSVAVGTPYQLAYQPNTVTFATPVLPNGYLTNVSFRYYDLVSNSPAVATVTPDGLVSGVTVGAATISATLGALAVPGQVAVTVTAPLASPTTTAPAPTHPAGNVIALYNSSGTYTDVPVDTWAAAWGDPNTVANFAIGSKVVKKYVSVNYVGVEFYSPGPAIDASSYSHLHVDVWTPNGTKFGVQLVDNVGVNQAAAQVNFDQTTSPAITTGSWIGLDIPLTSFAGMNLNQLGQLLFLDNMNGSIERANFYIDNVYFWK